MVLDLEELTRTSGRTNAVNILTPMSRGWVRGHRYLLFPGTRIVDRGSYFLLGIPWPKMHNLRFFHFVQWNLIDRFPHVGDEQPREYLDHQYMLFLSNFNGDIDKYADDFSDAADSGLKMLWKGTPGFQPPRPATRFKEFIREQTFPSQHYYSAYPEATTNDIRCSLHVAPRWHRFERLLEGRPGSRLLQRFEQDVQAWLALVKGDRATPAEHGTKLSTGRFFPRRARELTLLCPFDRRNAPAMRREIDAFEPPGQSPFAELPVHFGRVAVLDGIRATKHQPGEPIGLQSAYLMVNAVFDGSHAAFITDLSRSAQLGKLLANCYNRPAPGDERAFSRYLRRCTVRSNWLYCDYPGATVGTVRLALAHQRQALDRLAGQPHSAGQSDQHGGGSVAGEAVSV